MPSDAPQLEYAPAAPIRRRKRIRRFVYLILVLTVGLIAWKYHAPFWQQTKLLYFEHQCLSYSAPADQVVYDEDDGIVSPLANSPGYQAVAAQEDYSTWKLALKPGTVAIRRPPVLEDYIALYGGTATFPGATVFMHELRNKAGMKRLVIVSRTPERLAPFLFAFGLNPFVMSPAGVNSKPEYHQLHMSTGMSVTDQDNQAPTQRLRFYAGQVDPANPARFTIKYDLMNQSGVVEGWLEEDGDTVALRIISGPALKTIWTNNANSGN